eukprot:1158097-Pelagomonas_calceolata.AAC.4
MGCCMSTRPKCTVASRWPMSCLVRMRINVQKIQKVSMECLASAHMLNEGMHKIETKCMHGLQSLPQLQHGHSQQSQEGHKIGSMHLELLH